MATAGQILQLRLDLGGLTIAQLSDVQAAAIIDKLAIRYPSGSPATIEAAQWVAYLEGRALILSEQTSYSQNEESVSQSDASKANMQLLLYWEKKLAAALKDEEDGVIGNGTPMSMTIPTVAIW